MTAKRFIATAGGEAPGANELQRAICVFADLEIELRGGSDLQLGEDTAFSLALAKATSAG